MALFTALLVSLSVAHAQDAPPPIPAGPTEASDAPPDDATDPDAPDDSATEHAEDPTHAGDSQAEHAEDPTHASDPEPEHADAEHPDEEHPDAEHADEAHGSQGHDTAPDHGDAPVQPEPVDPPPVQSQSAPAPAVGSGLFDFFGDDSGPQTETRPEVVVVNQGAQPAAGPLDRILPAAPRPGFRSALPLILIALLCGALAALFRRSTRDLRPSGAIPQALITVEVISRLLGAAFAIAAVAALAPRALAPAIPVVIVAAAIATGWSARDVLQDLVAGVFLGVEGQLRAGHWVRGDRYSGTVESMGLRVTWLRDVYGRRIVVPNRVLLSQPLVADDNPWPRIQFTVAMPSEAPTRTIRAALEEAILVSPWVAPTPDVEVHPDGIETGHWHIAVRLLDSRYADRFQGLLRERVEEILP